MSTILEVSDLAKHYQIKRFMQPDVAVKALDGVSFKLEKGKTLAVVGESGCGKSTLAKVLMQLEPRTRGEVVLNGKPMIRYRPQDYYRTIQMVFQDPYGSLNPRKKVMDIVGEPLLINTYKTRADREERVLAMLEQVGLRSGFADRYPHMFSGGQRQRIGIARALVLDPKVMVLDEPVSALDISIQAQVLNLLLELQDEFQLTYIFISHDLSVVRHIADEVMVLYFGKVVEKGDREQIFENPQHPYTQALLSATPDVFDTSKERVVLTGELPSPLDPPQGCAFASRCPLATDRCRAERPALEVKQGRQVACFEVN